MTVQRLPNLDANQRYTVDEACEYLRISRNFLYKKVRQEQIKLIKDGNRSYVPGSELIAQSRVPA